jgi:hypothetical protein
MSIAAGTGSLRWAPTPSPGRRLRAATLLSLTAVLLALLSLPGRGAVAPRPAVPAAGRDLLGATPVFFERNAGQVTDPSVRFMARTRSSSLLLRRTSATVVTKSGTLTMTVAGASPRSALHPVGMLPGVVNYIGGNRPSGWHTRIPTSSGVTAAGVYPGVDLAWHATGKDLEYDFNVAPGADPRRIAIDFHGARSIGRAGNGDLLITMPDGTVTRHGSPVVYQRSGGATTPVSGSYVLRGETLGFRIGAYDHARPLTIDPLLYSSLISGAGNDQPAGVAMDSSGDAYVTGGVSTSVAGGDFPVTPGAFQTVDNQCSAQACGGTAGYVAKFDPTQSGAASLVYATYLGRTTPASGGSSSAVAPTAIAVDAAGDAYVVGNTSAVDFPVVNAFQPTIGGGSFDGFLSELNPSGSALLYSTYLGGSGTDSTSAVALDGAGQAYVTGETTSTNFPVVSPLQPTIGGGQDQFVAKLDTGGSGPASLLYSTYLGGSGTENFVAGIAVDTAGDMFVGGQTSSTNFPGTAGSPIQPANGGGSDGFVTELSADGQHQIYSSYLGGTASDAVTGITVDGTGAAYAVGSSASANYPVTPGVLQPTLGGATDTVVTKVAPGGSSLAWSTYLGGNGIDTPGNGGAIKLDDSGNVWVTGATLSSNFPTVAPVQAALAGGRDAFISELNPTATGLLFSTYLGSATSNGGIEGGAAIAVHGGLTAVAGTAISTGFPTTPNAFQSTGKGSQTVAFLAVLGVTGLPNVATGAASSVTDTGASVAGTVNPGSSPTNYTVEYGTTLAFGAIAPVTAAGSGSGDVPVSAALAGLLPSSTYYYRFVATNAVGTTVGSVMSFRTTGGTPVAPSVVTGAASGLTNTGASVVGQVNPNGQQTAYTFEYGTTVGFGQITPVVALDSAGAPETVAASLGGLAPATTYYYRVVATNATGTSVGSVRSFATGPGGPPTVSTGPPSAATATTGTLTGTLNTNGSQTAFAFEYGTTASFGSLSPVDNAGSAADLQAVSLTITGLAPGTTYLYRLIATNPSGTTTGAVRRFTTPTGP